MRWLITTYCCLLFTILSYGQTSSRALKKSGETLFKNYQYHKAYEQLEAYYQFNPDDDDIWQMLGIAAYHTNRLTVAERLLSLVTQSNKTTTSNALLFLAKTQQLQHQFTKAATTYKSFLITTKNTHPLYEMVKDELRRCSYALRKDFIDPTIIVENLGTTVNGDLDDFAPILSPNYQDRLYFSSIRAENLGGLRDEAGLQDNINGFYRADMYSTEVINGNWTAVSPMTALLNGPMNDVILDFSADGQVMYYYKGVDLYAGEAFVDTFKTLENRTLFSSSLETPYQPEAGDTAPFFYDENTLIFASRRAGGYGGLDLYWTEKRDGIWVAPRNMGATINSTYDETTPFLANDGQTLYFSSNHSQRSLGDYDIFKSNFSTKKTAWNIPQNLGLPINSAGDDRYFRLAKDGYRAFFSSRRKTSLGGLDIYSVYFKDYQDAQKNTADLVVFNQLITASNATTADGITQENANVITYYLEPLLFDDESNILSAKNIQQLQQVITILNQYPDLTTLITAHSDSRESEKFSLFFSIKRAEQISKYLLDNGVKKEQIIISGVGTNYPLAKEFLDDKPNFIGQKLNRRITLEIPNVNNIPIAAYLKYPSISPLMATFAYKFHQNINNGIVFRVQIATSPQMYNGDILNKYAHPLVEKYLTQEDYQYLLGRYNTYFSAKELQKELILNGVTDALVVPYLNGQRLSLEMVTFLVKNYPNLQLFLDDQIKE